MPTIAPEMTPMNAISGIGLLGRLWLWLWLWEGRVSMLTAPEDRRGVEEGQTRHIYVINPSSNASL